MSMASIPPSSAATAHSWSMARTSWRTVMGVSAGAGSPSERVRISSSTPRYKDTIQIPSSSRFAIFRRGTRAARAAASRSCIKRSSSFCLAEISSCLRATRERSFAILAFAWTGALPALSAGSPERASESSSRSMSATRSAASMVRRSSSALARANSSSAGPEVSRL